MQRTTLYPFLPAPYPFSVPQSLAIARQEKHHQHVSFQDEYRKFLHEHSVAFDERYVWD